MSRAAQLLPVLLQQRILILDGAMGTMIQRYQLSEERYRGSRFADFSVPGKQQKFGVSRAIYCIL